ncbi:MAG: hypothetical protein J6U96_00485 [Elusimicrobiaceae bacterium]|nr:hypothetical protein [Elusimicrobiaceae bacterium]
MRTLVQAYFDYRHEPANVVRTLVRERQFGAAFLGYFVAALCWVCFFYIGDQLSAWGFVWRFLFFWLLELTIGYLWASISGLFLSFFSRENGAETLFISLGLSGFVQGLLLCFALWAAAFKPLEPLAPLMVSITSVLRFLSAVINTGRAGKVGLNKALAALCFALVPLAAIGCLIIGAVILLAN